MAVYIDTPKPIFFKGKNRMFVHMVADSLQELHQFAEQLGMPKRIFQDKPNRPHYDVFDHHIKRALSLGALQISNKDLLRLLKRVYGD